MQVIICICNLINQFLARKRETNEEYTVLH